MQELFLTDTDTSLCHVLLMVEKDKKAEFGKRLNQLCDDMQLPAVKDHRHKVLGELFGAKYAAARKWLEGESLPKTDRIISMAEWANVSAEWLLSGNGPKRMIGELGINDAAPVYLSLRERALLENLRKCQEEERRAMERWALLCAEAQQEPGQVKTVKGGN